MVQVFKNKQFQSYYCCLGGKMEFINLFYSLVFLVEFYQVFKEYKRYFLN